MSNLFDYHIKDSRDLNALIKNPRVDVIITSPPYWNLKNYGIKKQIGFGQKYHDYMKDLINIFKKCGDVLKRTGSLWIVVDSFKKGGNVKLLPFELANKLQKNGLYLQDIIIWQKDKTLPWSSKGKLRNIFEYILFFTKDKKRFKYHVDKLREIELKKWWIKYPERYNPKGKIPSRVWNISIPTQGWGKSLIKYFCPFPPRLIEKILLLTTNKGDVVLDPFAGSGAVLAQAKIMKRKAIGFDLNVDYKKMYLGITTPFFKEAWKQREKELNEIGKKRNYLKKTIIKLRQLKYPVSLLKELRNNGFNALIGEIIGIIVIADTKKLDAKYYFIFKNKKDKKRKIEILYKISQKEKLKKFSLKPTFFVEDVSIIKNKLKPFNFFYVYEKAITNYFKYKIEFNELYQYLNKKNKQTIILSNLKVDRKTHILS